VLAQISPLVVAPAAYLLLGERQSLVTTMGLLGAFAGAVLLAGVDGSDSHVGDGLALLSGVSYAAYLLIAKRLATMVAARRIVLWNCAMTIMVVTPLALESGVPALPHTL
jgi:drug/metabolite transporter (DMT)-like permease